MTCPVVLMDRAGSRPGGRCCPPASGNGPDVAELDRNLIALGYAHRGCSARPGETFTAATSLGRGALAEGPWGCRSPARS